MTWILPPGFVTSRTMGSRSLSECLLVRGPTSVTIVFGDIVVITSALALSPSHSNIASDTYSTTLLSNSATENGRLGQTRELLCAIDNEHFRLHLHSPIKRCLWSSASDSHLAVHRSFFVNIIKLLRLLVEIEAEAIFALVSDRQIREDEITSFRWTVEVSHSRDRHACQDRDLLGRRLRLVPRWCHWTCYFQSSKEEKVGFVREGHVFLAVRAVSIHIVYAQLNDRWRINWSSVGRCLIVVSRVANRSIIDTYTLPLIHKLLRARVVE